MKGNILVKDTALRLVMIMEEYPSASQKKWAEMLGVSQGRVSQSGSLPNRKRDNRLYYNIHNKT
ncbi:hypothetical protein J7E78_08125 [Paenibacillus polymyxa]|uniref:hypothetical protein n=1 Tax=Paenibacillus polymyxa TaxID=1406 RepID=UPI001BE69346|nr:hypothetical protein [Paenibacillus polymyxa]MBT2283503.1 hypothetical protein [Paenibacillus polymyxa]